MPTLSNLIDNRELLDFSQHFSVARNYMVTSLFPDQKTQYIEQEYSRLCENGNLPMTAAVHALDTEAQIASRIPFEKVNVEELLIKEKINLSEEIRRLTRGMNMNNDALRTYIFDDVARRAEAVVTRAIRAKYDALAKGKFVIAENNLAFEVDYGIPEENYVTSDWDDADADILGDIRTWRALAIAKGYRPNMAVTTEAVLTKIMTNAAIQTAIFGTSGTGILPSLDQINALFRSQFGFGVTTDDTMYGEIATVDGKTVVNQQRFFPENTFVLATAAADGSLGIGLWGVTPEEDEQGGAFDTKRQQQFVTVVTWDTPDPVATWTKASGLFVPVLPNPYGHIIATVATADDSEG
jgi:hypothetical protein